MKARAKQARAKPAQHGRASAAKPHRKPNQPAPKPPATTRRAAAKPTPKPGPKPGHALRRAQPPTIEGLAQNAPLREFFLSDIHPDPDNPRKRFPTESIAELAEAIAAQGLLQNLVVRPRDPGSAGVLLVAGERRWRALKLLADAGRLPASATIPCRLIQGDAGAIRAAAIVENLQREDLAPLEEAEGLAELARLWEVPRIVTAIGRSESYVRQRLNLVRRLHPPIKQALGEGRITLTQARALTLVPGEKQQARALQEITQGYRATWDGERLENAFAAELPKVGHQLFELALYQGGQQLVKSPWGGKPFAVFLDSAAFWALQQVAIDRLRATLDAKWPWVKVVKGDCTRHDARARFPESKAKGAGAVIWVAPDGKVTSWTRVARTAEVDSTSAKPPKAEPPWVKQQREQDAAAARHAAIFRAVEAALRPHIETDHLAATALLLADAQGHWQDELLVPVAAADVDLETLTAEQVLALPPAELQAVLGRQVAARINVGEITSGIIHPVYAALAKRYGVDLGQARRLACEQLQAIIDAPPQPEPAAAAAP